MDLYERIVYGSPDALVAFARQIGGWPEREYTSLRRNVRDKHYVVGVARSSGRLRWYQGPRSRMEKEGPRAEPVSPRILAQL